MNNRELYELTLKKQKTSFSLLLEAKDSAHIQAQAVDISRAFEGDEYNIKYYEVNSKLKKNLPLSELFTKLAFSDFHRKECFLWEGSITNQYPCIYLSKKRVYIRPLILKYFNLDSNCTVKVKCQNKHCINPYHFEYCDQKRTKLTCGDLQLLVAYRGQGVNVRQIAKALQVHRSTIYRKLTHECFSAGTTSNSVRTRK